jgi:hypothetical protein
MADFRSIGSFFMGLDAAPSQKVKRLNRSMLAILGGGLAASVLGGTYGLCNHLNAGATNHRPNSTAWIMSPACRIWLAATVTISTGDLFSW